MGREARRLWDVEAVVACLLVACSLTESGATGCQLYWMAASGQ